MVYVVVSEKPSERRTPSRGGFWADFRDSMPIVRFGPFSNIRTPWCTRCRPKLIRDRATCQYGHVWCPFFAPPFLRSKQNPSSRSRGTGLISSLVVVERSIETITHPTALNQLHSHANTAMIDHPHSTPARKGAASRAGERHQIAWQSGEVNGIVRAGIWPPRARRPLAMPTRASIPPHEPPMIAHAQPEKQAISTLPPDCL